MSRLLDEDAVQHVLERRARHHLGLGADALLGAVSADDLPHTPAVPHLFALVRSFAGGDAPGLALEVTGSSPDDAIAAYLQVLEAGLSCISDAGFMAGRRIEDGAEGGLVVSLEPEPVELVRPGRQPAYLAVSENLRCVPDCAAWRVQIEAYYYLVGPSPQLADPLSAWHWHPGRYPEPHHHIDDQKLNGPEPIPMRVPSGWVSLAAVLRHLVADLHVEPRDPAWERTFDEMDTRLYGGPAWLPARR